MADRIYSYEMPDEPTAEELEAERETVRGLFAEQPHQRRAYLGPDTPASGRNPRPIAEASHGSHRHQRPDHSDPEQKKQRRNRENASSMFRHDEGTRKMIFFNEDGSTDVELN